MTKILIDRSTVEQALEALEEFCEHQTMLRPIEKRESLKAALAEPTVKESLQVESAFAENATTQQQLEEAPPSDYRRGYWDGFEIGKREGRIEAENALAEPVQEPVAWLSRDDARLALWQAINKREFGNPTDDKLILDHLHQQGLWIGKYTAPPQTAEPVQEPVEPVAYIHRQGRHWEVSERPLADDEKARGWTEEPLYTAPTQRAGESVQEPVAWRFEARHIDSAWAAAVTLKHPGPEGIYMRNVMPLYTAPPQRLPLTSDKDRPDQGATYVEGYGYVDTRAVRAIERAHGIGGEE